MTTASEYAALCAKYDRDKTLPEAEFARWRELDDIANGNGVAEMHPKKLAAYREAIEKEVSEWRPLKRETVNAILVARAASAAVGDSTLPMWPDKVETFGGNCYVPGQVEKWRDAALAEIERLSVFSQPPSSQLPTKENVVAALGNTEYARACIKYSLQLLSDDQTRTLFRAVLQVFHQAPSEQGEKE